MSSSNPDAGAIGAIDAILTRRSTREGFQDRPVEPTKLRQIVACGLAAPSSKNARPWCLHVVSDRALLVAFAQSVRSSTDRSTYVPHDPTTGLPRPEYKSTVEESADVLAQVPAAIFVENLGVFSGGRNTLATVEREAMVSSLVGYTLEVVGIGAAIENMWLAAYALGLQVAFMGDILIAEAAIGERLGVQGDLIGVLALGYADAGVSRARDTLLSDPSRVSWYE